MLLQATLNGPLSKADHPAVPTTISELSQDAGACAAAGAQAFHLHPRDESGVERLDAANVDVVVAAVRGQHGLPVGVTTGAWIEPDLDRRIAQVSEWTEPDYATVNLSEDGSLEVMQALLRAGIGVEAGVWTVADAELLLDSGLASRMLRICIEPVEVSRADAVELVRAIHGVLDHGGAAAPRLQHGDGEATWILIEDAIARGIGTRVGLEDTFLMPDGTTAQSNAELVRAARALGAGHPGS
ncbi:MAG TPA: 3-keto-5-aminohexanoate cleavage protein [Streptosporangiaceae bacterium]|jgi:uncharacterized protein (DUF849 family)